MYLYGNQICYVGLCLRSVSDENKGLVSDLCDAVRSLKPEARLQAMNRFLRLEVGRADADPAIRRVRTRMKATGQRALGRGYVLAVYRELRKCRNTTASDPRDLIPE